LVKASLPFLFLAVLNLIIGLIAGLSRIGWGLHVGTVAVHHGGIMVGGFLGALIALEKAIPIGKKWVLIVPVFCALTPLIAVSGFHDVGLGFMLAGSLGLLGIQSWYLMRFPRDRSMFLMVIGASCLVIGNVMLISSSFYPSAFPWWMGFVLFTIVGERVELSKFLPVTATAKKLLFLFLSAFIVGLALPFHGVGKYFSGVSLVAVALWLLRHDVIRVAMKGSGLVRYSAMALLIAYTTLMVEGIFLVALPDGAFSYDTLVHVFFICFVFTMIFAHGPIILPSVLGIARKPYHPLFYLWLALLQVSVVLRIAGNTVLQMEWRRIGGALSTVTIIGYFVTIAALVLITPQPAAKETV
jgi:hypothetical protein